MMVTDSVHKNLENFESHKKCYPDFAVLSQVMQFECNSHLKQIDVYYFFLSLFEKRGDLLSISNLKKGHLNN